MALLSCPFCRALYTPGEAEICPECGLALVPLQRLPPSADALGEEPAQVRLPEHELLPWSALGRGRGLVVALALAGIASFFLPWVELTFPEAEFRSGFDLARGRAGWLWGGAVGWFVAVPLVLSRRTIAAMRGVRPITAALCAMTLGEVIMLLAVPPSAPRQLAMTFEWAFGLYLSGALSAAGALTALFLGGPLPPLPPEVPRSESSLGETIH